MSIAISGNLSRYFEYEDPTKHFTYTFSIIPASITFLFRIVILLPTGLRFAIKCFGNTESEIPVLHGIGIYAYSFSSFIVASLFCGMIPIVFV